MSNRKSGNKTNKTDRGAFSNNSAADFSRMDYLAVVPGVLMCLITLLMLIVDLAMPEMAQAQYSSYPALFRGADLVIAAAGIIYYIIFIFYYRKNTKSAAPTKLGSNHSALGNAGNDHIAPGKLASNHGTTGKLGSDHAAPSLASGGAQKASCIFFCLFIVCIILSTAVNGLDDKAIHGVSFRDIGIFNLISFILIYMGLSSMIGSSHLRRFVLLFYIAVADLIAIAAAADKWISPIPAFGEKKDISAIFFNGNHYGYFLVMAILLSAGLFLYSQNPDAQSFASSSRGSKNQDSASSSRGPKNQYSAPHAQGKIFNLRSQDMRTRIFAACSMALNGLILALNGSTGCILAVSAGLLLTLAVTLTTRRDALKMNLILLAVLAAALAVIALRTSMLQTLASDIASVVTGSAGADSAGHNRWLLWTTTVDYISSKPLLGYGCEGLSDILMETTGRADPHNEILSYAAQFGIPAAVFYTAGVILTLTGFFTPSHYYPSACASGKDQRSQQEQQNSTACASRKDQHSELSCGSSSEHYDAPDETRAACFLAAAGYFISSLFGVTMFYTLPFFFIFLGMSTPRYQNNL